MSERAPTPEQAAAIAAAGHDVMVEAGAGTGKTGVMVNRYCRLVCDLEAPLDAVLAFTFTDKAASELRRRIRTALELRAAAGSPRAAELLPAIGGAWVTTIHGFCNRLLASHPVAAGIDPRFRVLRHAGGRAGGARRLSTTRSPSSSPTARRRASGRWPRLKSAACGRSSAAFTPSCAAAARTGRDCRRRPSPTSRRRCAGRPPPRRRR